MENYKGYNEKRGKNWSKKYTRELKKALVLLSCGLFFITAVNSIIGKNYSKVYSNSDFSLIVNFNSVGENYKYSYKSIEKDFGKINFVSGGNRLFVKEDALWIHYPVDVSRKGDSGATINSKIPESNEYTLEYEVFFDGCGSEFNWQEGGVLSGLAGGEFYEGTEEKISADGFHSMLVYDNKGYIYPYIYVVSDADAGGKLYQGVGSLAKDSWNKVKMYVKVNDKTQANGILRVWINDKLAFNNESIRYTTENVLIDTNNLCAYNNLCTDTLENEQYVCIRNYTIRNRQ